MTMKLLVLQDFHPAGATSAHVGEICWREVIVSSTVRRFGGGFSRFAPPGEAIQLDW